MQVAVVTVALTTLTVATAFSSDIIAVAAGPGFLLLFGMTLWRAGTLLRRRAADAQRVDSALAVEAATAAQP